MIQQLKGKIYWVLDDFNYIGVVTPEKNQTDHIVARISDVIVEAHMIKFQIEPYQHKKVKYNYYVNLLNEHGNNFKGTFADVQDGDWNGEVNCEIFSNTKRHMLYGRWIEEEEIYTFWALIDR